MNTNFTLFVWPGDQPPEPRDATAALDADMYSEENGIRVAKAIFSVLTISQQERVVERLGWVRHSRKPVATAEDTYNGIPIDAQRSGAGYEAPGSPQEAPGSTGEAQDAREPHEGARSALEASHVAQWIELSSRAANFGCKIWPTGHGFAIQVDAFANDGGGMWREVDTLSEVRAALSDYVSHERALGREPRPPQDPLSAAIVKAAERAGLDIDSLPEHPTQAALLGLVQNMGQMLYQHMMDDMNRGPVQSLSFVEEDGTERLIVWEAGDPSVGISSGYRADDDEWSKRGEAFTKALNALKEVQLWAEKRTAKVSWPSAEALQGTVERTLNEIEPKWKEGGGA